MESLAFEEEDWVWVVACGCGFDIVKMAAQHCDELRCVFERGDADERGVLSPRDVRQGTCLDSDWPF